ncbi:hypothetical protein IRJ33_01540 [Mycolicibacterium smegmatis]|nr:hypothetical protein [Mycolicibacterium smegmatis]MBE9622681.1 hypothetical protein [Mycolicibacterium smegmatis]MBE9629395.1 hypothetical protein [Mycolicibacterium smegmatis]MBE9641536.1 hypothetical protein [Mycolicibacterium smegmatis]MBE9647721.1 hypothetical protein [Mycolicibacterium smegmatis]
MQLPGPRVVQNSGGGAAAEPPGAAAEAVAPPVLLPVVVAPVIVPPALAAPQPDGGGGPGGTEPRRPAATPTLKFQTPATGQPQAVGALDAGAPPASFRAGYTDYLRTAEVFDIVAVAVPGTAGLLGLTGLGGLVGYRQAKAGVVVRSSASRFMP